VENKIKNSNNRIKWIDACKGFTIILVVMGHVADGYLNAGLFLPYKSILTYSRCLVYSFHMPLFFVLSGITFYIAYVEKNRKNKFIYQIVNLIWIYFIFSIIQWCFQKLFNGSVNNSYSLYDLILIPIKPIALYWYLYVLIFLYMISYKIVGNKIRNITIFLITICVSLFAAFYKFNNTGFPLRLILYFFAFFWMGIIIISNLDVCKNRCIVTISLMITIISFVVTIMEGKVIGYWGNCIFPLAICFICVYVFFNIKIFNQENILILFGKYSLEIYLFHSYITAGNRIFLFKIGIESFAINVLINFFMAISIPILISKIMKKLNIHKYIFKFGNIICYKVMNKKNYWINIPY
jgi:fucose 4-O-acetylase-like acetyltransferase